MYIKPTKEAKGSIFDIEHEDIYDILLYRVQEDNACPWDPDIYIEGDKVVIEGSIVGSGPSTPDGSGYCRCEVSIEKFDKFYKLEVPDANEGLVSAVLAAGWVKA